MRSKADRRRIVEVKPPARKALINLQILLSGIGDHPLARPLQDGH